VIDECHIAITADSWRPRLVQLKNIQLLLYQLILLTTTLPPSQVGLLYKALLLHAATTIRARSTQRLGTQYTILYYQRGKLRQRAIQQARQIIEEAQSPTLVRSSVTASAAVPVKSIIYCCS
jgi:hypothetical protein